METVGWDDAANDAPGKEQRVGLTKIMPDFKNYSFLDIFGEFQEYRLSRNSEIIAGHLSPIFFSMVFPEILPDWRDASREARNSGLEASISSSISSIVSLSSTNPRVAPFVFTNLTIPFNFLSSDLQNFQGFTFQIISIQPVDGWETAFSLP